jgi:hypothetical protein
MVYWMCHSVTGIMPMSVEKTQIIRQVLVDGCCHIGDDKNINLIKLKMDLIHVPWSINY